ncbi:MAG: methyltransferase [Euryarchaeota archaeon]|nr:methyltransferase [Euryarchaeota archaeon]
MKYDPSLVRQVRAGVYPPAEDSQLFIESVEVVKGMRVLDMGTGSGVAALHCARDGAAAVATDIDPEAARCALENARANNFSVDVVLADIFDGIRGRFDLILFNAPYLPHESDGEPRSIDGGEGGAELIGRFIAKYKEHLRPGGKAIIIASNHTKLEGFEGYRVIGERKLPFEKIFACEFE